MAVLHGRFDTADFFAVSTFRVIVVSFVIAVAGVLVISLLPGEDDAESTTTTEPVPLSLDDGSVAPGADVTIGSVEVGELQTFAPEGWQFEAALSSFAAPEGSEFEGALWSVVDRCPGECVRRTGAEWVTIIDDALGEIVGGGEVVRDAEVFTGRVVEVVDGDERRVAVARWIDGEAAYVWCALSGDADATESLVPVLEFACENTRAPAA